MHQHYQHSKTASISIWTEKIWAIKAASLLHPIKTWWWWWWWWTVKTVLLYCSTDKITSQMAKELDRMRSTQLPTHCSAWTVHNGSIIACYQFDYGKPVHSLRPRLLDPYTIRGCLSIYIVKHSVFHEFPRSNSQWNGRLTWLLYIMA